MFPVFLAALQQPPSCESVHPVNRLLAGRPSVRLLRYKSLKSMKNLIRPSVRGLTAYTPGKTTQGSRAGQGKHQRESVSAESGGVAGAEEYPANRCGSIRIRFAQLGPDCGDSRWLGQQVFAGSRSDEGLRLAIEPYAANGAVLVLIRTRSIRCWHRGKCWAIYAFPLPEVSAGRRHRRT